MMFLSQSRLQGRHGNALRRRGQNANIICHWMTFMKLAERHVLDIRFRHKLV